MGNIRCLLILAISLVRLRRKNKKKQQTWNLKITPKNSNIVVMPNFNKLAPGGSELASQKWSRTPWIIRFHSGKKPWWRTLKSWSVWRISPKDLLHVSWCHISIFSLILVWKKNGIPRDPKNPKNQRHPNQPALKRDNVFALKFEFYHGNLDY